MSVGEFDLIARWFTRPARRAVLGVGDDCALLLPAPGMQLAISSDMLVEGRHFLPTVPPERLGHKALAVNLSDLAACGARPVAFTLALSMPRVDEAFVEGFARGMWALADAQGVDLVGGDTTAGPLNICITVIGEVPAGQALLRSGAHSGDELWVSGALGDARLALEAFRNHVTLGAEPFAQVRAAMECPQPRVALGQALRDIATSAIDLSDGLLGDLAHVLERSGVGADVELARLPHSEVLAAQPEAMRHECLLAGGDDYELLFTAPAAAQDAVRAAGRATATRVTKIGRIVERGGVTVLDTHGRPLDCSAYGAFDHFRS